MYTIRYTIYIKYEHHNDGSSVFWLAFWATAAWEESAAEYIYLQPNGPNASPVVQPHSGRTLLLQI